MSLIQLIANNTAISVIEGTVHQTLTGVWLADLQLDQIGADQLTADEGVTLQSYDKTWQMIGVINIDRNNTFLDSVRCRIVGGAGGMGKPVIAKAYQNAIIKDVLNDLMASSGETLSSTTDNGFLNTKISFWSIFTDNTTTSAIVNLIDHFAPTMNWRILNDGTVWIGNDTYPDITTEYQFQNMDYNAVEQYYDLGIDQPYIYPGLNIPSFGHVTTVEHVIKQDQLRTHIYITLVEQNRSIQESVKSLVIASLPSIDYLANYKVKVVSQSNDNLTVDIQPIDSRLPGMSAIPIRIGVPGATAQLQSGCFMLLGWADGDIGQPYVESFTGETVIQLNLNADKIIMNNGTNNAARVGDSTVAHNHTITFDTSKLLTTVEGSAVGGTLTGTIANASPKIDSNDATVLIG